MKKLWAGWKVYLLWLGLGLLVVVGVGVGFGIAGVEDPEAAGERFGRVWAIVIALGPLVAYIIQKMRIDHASRPAARRAARDQAPPPPTA